MSWRNLRAAVAALVVAGQPLAAQVIDQQQTTVSTVFGQLNNGWSLQSFTPSASTSVGAGFYLYNLIGVQGPFSAKIQLWSGIPSSSTSTLLAEATGESTVASGEGRWFDLFWNPVTVTAGNTYYVGIHGTTSILTTYGTGYAGGNANFNYNASPTAPYSNSWNILDFTFRTYALEPRVTVPEPSTFGLVVAGLLGLVAVRKRLHA